ncbi:CAP domain-containing protein, partial [Roseovarius sp. SYSU LYC5161]|uniref:CAP domain-containing protein n=1 Tax=Roseovarius halophilus (ex Wu et al. 2025) TaxID=3376060 RepID=UPI00399C4523
MQHPSDFEQSLLEFINRARTDPQGEFDELIVNAATGEAVADNITNALDFFDTDLDLLRDQFDALTPVAPVAWNSALGQSAETHSQLMIDFDEQSHYLGDEPGYLERVTEAGYARPQTVAENIYAFGQDPLHTHAGFFIDWGDTPTGIQNPPGHRDTIMDPVYDEVGLSDLAENDPDTDVGPHVVTQHFATRRDYAQQLVGVVINDTDNDDQYDLGEGMGDIRVTAENAFDSFITSTWDSGGYQMALPAGTYDVTFSGAALDGVVTASVTIGGENVKLDAQAASASRPASSANPGDEITGSETADTLVGTDADDTIDGLDGDDVIAGRAGNDTLTGGDGDDQIAGSDGDDVIDGGAGRDN